VVKDYQDVILVKENGLRFYDETVPTRTTNFMRRRWRGPAIPTSSMRRPDLGDLRRRRGDPRRVDVKPPHVDPAGYFFNADTIEELAGKIVNDTSAAMQGRLCANRSNGTIPSSTPALMPISGSRGRCTRSPSRRSMRRGTRRRCTTPNTGIRIKASAEVIDLHGKVIPGLHTRAAIPRAASVSTASAGLQRSAASRASMLLRNRHERRSGRRSLAPYCICNSPTRSGAGAAWARNVLLQVRVSGRPAI